jgi:hypothetical protein
VKKSASQRGFTPSENPGRQIPNGEMPVLIVDLMACTVRYMRSTNRSTLSRGQRARASAEPLKASRPMRTNA